LPSLARLRGELGLKSSDSLSAYPASLGSDLKIRRELERKRKKRISFDLKNRNGENQKAFKMPGLPLYPRSLEKCLKSRMGRKINFKNLFPAKY
jgi:hypothetical protein